MTSVLSPSSDSLVHSLHTLIISRSRQSPLDEISHPFDNPQGGHPSLDLSSCATSDRSDSPSLYSRAGRSSSILQEAPHMGDVRSSTYTVEGGHYDDRELTSDGSSRSRRASTASTISPSFGNIQTLSSLQHSFLSPSTANLPLGPGQTSSSSSLTFDDNSTLSGSSSSPRSSVDAVAINRDGPKLRFGEAAPWELDSPSWTAPFDVTLDGYPRRPSIGTLDPEPSLSTSSSNVSFKGSAGGGGGVTNGLRTRTRSATHTAAGVLKGWGGLVGRKKSRDAEESLAALEIGIETELMKEQGTVSSTVSSETVMLGAELFPGGGETDASCGNGSSPPKFGQGSPSPSRSVFMYSNAMISAQEDVAQQFKAYTTSPHRPIPPFPTGPKYHHQPVLPPSPMAMDTPSFTNNTQHHGLISLEEAQARQREKTERVQTHSSIGEGGLLSPLPSPEPANSKVRARALTGSLTIRKSSSEASVFTLDSLGLTELDGHPKQQPLDSRRASSATKLLSTGISSEQLPASPILPTPTKLALKNKKSVGALKWFSKSPASSSASTVVAPPPSPPPSVPRPTVQLIDVSAISIPHFVAHPRTPPVAAALHPVPADSFDASTPTCGFSSVASNPLRTKLPPPSIKIPANPTTPSHSAKSSLTPVDQLSVAPFPTLKLRPVSIFCSSNLPQSYFSSSPPLPMPQAPPSPYFEAGSLLRPPPSPSATSFVSFAFTSAEGSTLESGSLLSPTSASSGGFFMREGGMEQVGGSQSVCSAEQYVGQEKDLVIKKLQEMIINERKITRIRNAEYVSQVRELQDALNPPTVLIPSRSSDLNTPSSTSACTCGHLSSPSSSTASVLASTSTPTSLYAAPCSVLNRSKPKTGGPRGVFGSGSLRE